jgi:hypothetical protein
LHRLIAPALLGAFRYFSSTSTEQISPDSTGPFTSFDPVGFAIFATHAQVIPAYQIALDQE